MTKKTSVPGGKWSAGQRKGQEKDTRIPWFHFIKLPRDDLLSDFQPLGLWQLLWHYLGICLNTYHTPRSEESEMGVGSAI